jgi:enterochelin esterase-like enzyme
MKNLSPVLIVCLAPILAAAQSPQQGAPAAGAPQRVAGAEVRPDRTIVFRISAPKASEVSLVFSESETAPRPMTKDAAGVWNLTVGPVEPEIYPYWFVVDGVRTVDVSNPVIKIGSVVDGTVVEVPANPPRFDQLQNVSHGSLNLHTYASKTLGRQRMLFVYVPPEYYSEPSRRFPVLYLYHGGRGSELQWANEGRANVIMDNLIAGKKAVPMIVAIPNANLDEPGPLVGQPAPPAGAAMDNYVFAEKEIVNDIVPFVEKQYRTVPDREHRALAGLSAGGGVSMNVGLKRLDVFAWIGEFSSGLFGGVGAPGTFGSYAPFDVEKLSPGFLKDPAATNKRLRLLYFSCGQQDSRLPFQTKAAETLRAQKINVTFNSYPGVHEWKVWRHSLADFAPLLFR